MNKKYQPKRTNVKREAETLPLKFTLVAVVSGALLVGGFLFAAKTHFAAITYCIGNSELKKELSELEAEKRRLLLSKEMALAPAEIKKFARKLGLVDITAINIAASESPATRAAQTPGPLVVKTADSKPVETPKMSTVAGDVRERRVERSEKTAPAPADTRDRKFTKTGK